MTTTRHFLSDRPPTARFKMAVKGGRSIPGISELRPLVLPLTAILKRDYFGLAEKWLSLSAKDGLFGKRQVDHTLWRGGHEYGLGGILPVLLFFRCSRLKTYSQSLEKVFS